MTLRYKFVLPINLILVLVLGISLAWEWRRQQAAGVSLLRARLGEEARFVHAAYRAFGDTPRFAAFLDGFCRATDPSASPGHQVAIWDEADGLVASAPEHPGHRPLDPSRLATLGEGFWTLRNGDQPFLVRVSADGGRRVAVAESTRAVRDRVWASLRGQVVWPLSTGVLLLAAINIVMRRAVLRPVRRLSRAARLIEQGHLGTQVEIDFDGEDELGALSRQFNAMSRTLVEEAEANRREMETARRVQAHLLPPPRFRLGCLEVAGRCLPAGPVGGDVYDVQALPGGRVAVLVADLSGHNVAAALHTAMVRAIVWREAEQAQTPGEVMARLNERLCRDLPAEHFATAFFGWFEPQASRLRYANAGHPPAYLQAPAGPSRELDSTGPLLGVIPDVSYADASDEVGSGERLLVMTDGLTETQDPEGNLLGTAEVLALLEAGRSWEPGRLVDGLLDRAAAFRCGRPQLDDLTIVLATFDSDPELDSSVRRPYASIIPSAQGGQVADG